MKSKRRPFFLYKPLARFFRAVGKRRRFVMFFAGGVLAGLFLHAIFMAQFSKWFIEGSDVLAGNVSQDYKEIAHR